MDGQHRVGALDILLKNEVLTAEDRVLVEVFPDVDDKKAVDLFMEINSAQPIRFVDLPGVTTPDVKWMLEGAVQRLKEAHPTMFSDSARCKMPNVNLDNLREELFAAEVTTRFNITAEKDFVSWLDGGEALQSIVHFSFFHLFFFLFHVAAPRGRSRPSFRASLAFYASVHPATRVRR